MKPKRCNNQIKFDVRQKTIVDPYQQLFGSKLKGQYITLCNVQKDEEWYEYCQMTNSNFVKPNQFYGIDTNQNIINQNKIELPKANWHCDDIENALCTMASENNFKPGIIYFDSTSMKQRAIRTLTRLMKFISHHKIKKVLLVVNIIKKNGTSRKTNTLNEIYSEFRNNEDFNFEFYENNWNKSETCEEYQTGNTKMLTFSFYK